MKIYIPTFRRVDSQITFDNLPDKIKENVIMVVQEQERDEYKYDCEYLVVVDNIGIAKTREIIYHHAGKTKFGMIDDDVRLHRRNTKYYNEKPNMEKSKRIMTVEDWEYWFSLVNTFFEEPDIMHIGNREEALPPYGKQYYYNSFVIAVHWIDGDKLSTFIDEVDWNLAKTGEDSVFNIECLIRGYKNVIFDEVVMSRWATAYAKGGCAEIRTGKSDEEEHMKILKKYPYCVKLGRYEILKNIGKLRNFDIDCKSAYKSSQFKGTLKEFL